MRQRGSWGLSTISVGAEIGGVGAVEVVARRTAGRGVGWGGDWVATEVNQLSERVKDTSLSTDYGKPAEPLFSKQEFLAWRSAHFQTTHS